jgi:hypothetical protein
MRHRPVFPPSSACGKLLKIKGMVSSMAADLMSMNQRQQRQRDDWHADPDYPLQEAGDDQAANHGSNDACLLEIKGADQHDV